MFLDKVSAVETEVHKRNDEVLGEVHSPVKITIQEVFGNNINYVQENH